MKLSYFVNFVFLALFRTKIVFRVATVRENIWKTEIFPGQGKVREICGWPGNFRKDLKSQGKVREFENKWLWQEFFRKPILFKKGKDIL